MRDAYTVGIDFGTESGRAVLVRCSDGAELATRVYAYRNGVIDDRLPDTDVELPPDWALQDPADYIRTLQETVPGLLADTGIDPSQVIGLGIDFTACTMLPTLDDGTPLCFVEELRAAPHAWVKLWKHHAAQPQADRINAVAEARAEPWLSRYGGKISSEWFFAKALQILEEAPAIYHRAGRLIEATDWVTWQLTGVETRNSCTAGYKAMWSKRDGFPSNDYFASLDPGFADIVDEKMSRAIVPLGTRAGGLSELAARWTGLPAGIAVATGNVDAHVSAPGSGVTEPGTLVAAMGTSICHILLGRELVDVSGMCGVVEDGVVPGLFGYEAGQSAVGDIFGWWTKTVGLTHDELTAGAARLRPGESGLLALDWWNGNRSVLVDAELSGLVVGMTLATRPADVYRALIEATAFGTRVIVDSFEDAGLAVDRVVACGGLPERSALLMQIYADVLGREMAVARSAQTPAVGAAIFGAVAAGAAVGGYDSVVEASSRMAGASRRTFVPDAESHAIYDVLYAEYRRLHDLFGRSDQIMRQLKQLARQAGGREAGGGPSDWRRPVLPARAPGSAAVSGS